MSSSELYEQRVVYAGLKRMTQDRNLIKAAYERWQTKAVNEPFDVFETVADLTSFLGLEDAERKTLMVALHAASSRLVDELDPVPEYVSSKNTSVPASADVEEDSNVSARPVSAHKAVTERYLQLLCQHVKRHSPESFRELVVIVSDEGLPKLGNLLNQPVKSWGASGLDKINFPNDIDSSDCQSVSLEFYVLLTEIIGPVDSDVIVNKAISEVLSMDAAQNFNPRDLL